MKANVKSTVFFLLSCLLVIQLLKEYSQLLEEDRQLWLVLDVFVDTSSLQSLKKKHKMICSNQVLFQKIFNVHFSCLGGKIITISILSAMSSCNEQLQSSCKVVAMFKATMPRHS